MIDWRWETETGCHGKKHLSQKIARKAAQEMRDRGERVCAYRCVWCDAGWCVGHVPSPERVAAIAEAIRARAQDPAA